MTIPPTPIRARPVAEHPLPPVVARRVDPMLLEGVTRRDALLDLLLVLVIGVAAPFLPGLAGLFGPPVEMSPPPELPEGGLASYLILTKYSEALVAVMLLSYLWLRHGLPRDTFPLVSRGFPLDFVFVLPILMSCYVVMILIGLAVMPGATEQIEDEVAQRLEFAKQLPTAPLTAGILLIAVAVHEEVLFRALLLPYLRRLLGNWTAAIIVGGVIFGSLHFPQGPTAMVQIAVVGMVLGTAYVLTRSLLAVMVTHWTFDFLQIQLIDWVRKQYESGAFDELAQGVSGDSPGCSWACILIAWCT